MRRKNAVLHGGGEELTPQTVLLKNDHMSIQVLLDWGYDRSRYDRGSTVGQVTVNGHTFLSRETDASGGAGLGGIGLAAVTGVLLNLFLPRAVHVHKKVKSE